MDNEIILRWLAEFGSDWVVVGKTLRDTWATMSIDIDGEASQGYLESNLRVYDAEPWKVRLTQKAIEKLEKGDG